MFLAAANKFLGTNHFIFLGICLVYIVVALVLLKKLKVPFNTVLNIMILVAIASELIKISEYLVPYYDGDVVQGYFFKKTGLPFHLCSIQLIFLLLTKVCKEGSFKDKLLAFVYPTAFLGALMALILATITIEFDRPLTWQFFIFHASLLIYGLYIPMSGVVEINTKMFINTCVCLVGVFFLSIYINGIISIPELDVLIDGEVVGATEGKYVYFFYSTEPPIDNLPILNMKNGFWVYLMHILTIGIVAVSAAHIPFFIKDYQKYKLNKAKNNN